MVRRGLCRRRRGTGRHVAAASDFHAIEPSDKAVVVVHAQDGLGQLRGVGHVEFLTVIKRDGARLHRCVIVAVAIAEAANAALPTRFTGI